MTALDLILVHPDQEAIDAFRHRFGALPRVSFAQGGYESLGPHDCFVTAANSYGMMTAGIDAVMLAVFGEDLMTRVQAVIEEDYLGEQPVGTSILVRTGNTDYPWIAHTPTMRMPCGIDGSANVYLATFAAFCTIHRHNRDTPDEPIRTVALPAMGTGFGGMTFDAAARQMALAYTHYLNPAQLRQRGWDAAVPRHKALVLDEAGNRIVSNA